MLYAFFRHLETLRRTCENIARETAIASPAHQAAPDKLLRSLEARDDTPTVCAISLLAAILSNPLHEGLGHAATAPLTGTKSGLLTTVAWSSDCDSQLVAAWGTLA